MKNKIAVILLSVFASTATIANETNTAVSTLKDISPVYPQSAIMRQHTGWAVLKFDVDENGKATEISITDSEPARVFDRAALKALKQTRFEVTHVNGEAVQVENQTRKYVFELDETIPGSLARN